MRPHIALAAVAAAPASRCRWPRAQRRAALAALRAAAALPQAWRIGSYSSLAHGARNESAAVDHDLRAQPVEQAAAGGGAR